MFSSLCYFVRVIKILDNSDDIRRNALAIRSDMAVCDWSEWIQSFKFSGE